MSSALLIPALTEILQPKGLTDKGIKSIARQVFSLVNSIPEYHRKHIAKAYLCYNNQKEKAIRLCFSKNEKVEDLILTLW